VGRGFELTQLREMLTAFRLVTLMGPGGTGKTRLAVATAQEGIEEEPEVAIAAVPLSKSSGSHAGPGTT
jgi:predicted ATPase